LAQSCFVFITTYYSGYLHSDDCYLLTNQRIILVWQHKEYKIAQEIFLEDLDQVYKHAIFNLCLISGQKKFI
jgi:hypothetical protein